MSRFNIFLGCLLLVGSSLKSATISNAADGGWLGDQLVNYVKAKYLSYKYNIPFRLKPFRECNNLMLSRVEQTLQNNRVTVVTDEKNINPLSNQNYAVSYSCRIEEWSPQVEIYNWRSVLNSEEFFSNIKRLICPIAPINFKFSTDTINIAVHIRKPLKTDNNRLSSSQFYDCQLLQMDTRNPYAIDTSGWYHIVRTPPMDTYCPYKFPPEQFYIDQIKKLHKLFSDKEFMIYIFSNDPEPANLINRFKNRINEPNMRLMHTEDWGSSVVHDLILMSQFDYLIRGRSNFSQIADLIGNQKMVISPKNFAWYKNENNENCLVVETVRIKSRLSNGKCAFTEEVCEWLVGKLDTFA